ncbi:MAG TPA: biotin/lipoyl-binding protein, partial [Blastocatellia bacterium]
MKLHGVKKLVTALMILSLILLAACNRKQEANAKTDGNANLSPGHVEVASAPVIERNTRRGLEVVGSLEAEDEVTLSSRASGNLDEISVDIGTPVRSGQLIGRLDQRELKLKVDQAEANLRQAEARLGVESGGKLDLQKQPDVRQAKAALDRARYDLNAAQNLAEHGDISKQQQDVYQKTFEQAEARYQAALENVRNLEAQIEEKR